MQSNNASCHSDRRPVTPLRRDEVEESVPSSALSTRQIQPMPICHTESTEPRQRTGIAIRFLR